MSKTNPSNKRFFFSITLLASLALLAVGVGGALHWRGVLASHWRHQLTNASEDQVAARLSQISSLGDEGVPILVEALTSHREAVALGSRDQLNDALNHWKTLRSRQSSPKVALLADHLARHVGQMSPSGKVFAADLATRILIWPLDDQVVDPASLIGHCEIVLRASAVDISADIPDDVAQATRRPGIRGQSLNSGVDVPLLGDDRFSERDVRFVVAVDDLPGGELPISLVEIPPLPPTLDVVAGVDVPLRFQPQEEPSPLAGPPTPNPPPPGVGEFPTDTPPLNRPPGENSSVSSTPNVADYRALARLEDLEVIHLLRDGRSVVENAAGRELRRRGFRAIHFPLALRLTDPDPQRRIELAELLPGMSGIDARPWLLWLSQDEDSQVRLAAITIMATSRDQQLLEYLRQLPSHESDPEILRQVERLLNTQSR